jgi:hypothetical protein
MSVWCRVAHGASLQRGCALRLTDWRYLREPAEGQQFVKGGSNTWARGLIQSEFGLGRERSI